MPLTLPNIAQSALLLDLDGTLLDIAPTPDSVVVPPGLIQTLQRLRALTHDALAIITGRPIDQVDALLPGIPFAVAGEHGGTVRSTPGAEIIRPPLPDPPVEWFAEAARMVDRHPGALLERKQRGFVVHYRNAPEAGPQLHEDVVALIAPHASRFQLLPALMAWEVRPRGVDKGVAVQALMTNTPFASRTPIFVGDDITDEDGMAAARQLGGAGLRIDMAFGTAANFRAWLSQAATSGTWPPFT